MILLLFYLEYETDLDLIIIQGPSDIVSFYIRSNYSNTADIGKIESNSQSYAREFPVYDWCRGIPLVPLPANITGFPTTSVRRKVSTFP
jgi:hypothetical protein